MIVGVTLGDLAAVAATAWVVASAMVVMLRGVGKAWLAREYGQKIVQLEQQLAKQEDQLEKVTPWFDEKSIVANVAGGTLPGRVQEHISGCVERHQRQDEHEDAVTRRLDQLDRPSTSDER